MTCQQTTEELIEIIRNLLPLALVGEHHIGGDTEEKRRKIAEALAEARKAAGQ